MGKTLLGRRSFLKASALFGSKFLAGATGYASFTNCSSRYEWMSIQYPKVLLNNFRLFVGLNNSLQKDRIVLIEGAKILGVERKGDLAQYKDFRHFDLNGYTLLPGLINNHVHMTSPFAIGGISVVFQKNEQFELSFKNCVINGITTVRDIGGFPGMVRKFKEKADNNEIPGPRVFSSLSMIAAKKGMQLGLPVRASYIEDPIFKWIFGGNFAERPQTVEEINEVCEEMVRLGAVWLKTLHQDKSFHHKGYSP
jgi:hypothetical protein